MRRQLPRAILLATVVVATAGLWPAAATPSDVRISAIYQLPCRDSDPVCDEDDSPVGSGALVDGTIQIQVSASSNVSGLRWVELRGRYGSGEWVCLKHWTPSSSSFRSQYDWGTSRWPGSGGSPPSGCNDGSSLNGALTRNGTYEFRVVAADTVGDAASSSIREVRVNNRPSTPSWASDPTVDQPRSEGDSAVVRLRWSAVPEPDVVEYRWVRTDPDGSRSTYEINAANPGRDGCSRSGSTYTCEDDAFASSSASGTYRYTIAAYRASAGGGSACATSSGSCLASGSSSERTASVSSPPPPSTRPTDRPANFEETRSGNRGGTTTKPSPTAPSPNVKESARVLGSTRARPYVPDFYVGQDYSPTLPYDSRGGFAPNTLNGTPSAGESTIAAAPTSSTISRDIRKLMIFLALGLVMVLFAGHFARLLRDR